MTHNDQQSRSVPITDLVHAARTGHSRSTARLISIIENGRPETREITEALIPHTGRAAVIGLTGPPGAGKSTITSSLITAYREKDKRVGVLAIDPSSPFSGGALLGDRIRMTHHSTDPNVFIRSMATRGHLGGLAPTTPQAVRVLDGAGFDIILIETVGVGQSEIDIVQLADTTAVILAPGLGDAVQAAKAGVLEIGDVFAVNKSDRDGADDVVKDLRYMVSYGRADPAAPTWRPPVVKTVAARHDGVLDLIAALDKHHDWSSRTGELDTRRARRAATEIEALVVSRMRRHLDKMPRGRHLADMARLVVTREIDPYAAADRLIDALTS